MNNLLSLSENFYQVEIIPTLFSFVLCVLMSFILKWFYVRRSFSLTGKFHIGSIIPILSSVVFLVIIIVKSSLALSLGLVGALSIVRFRTPIKEPEELVYLFLAIAIGLGYAAGQILITSILSLSILLMIFLWLSNRNSVKVNEYNLVINWEDQKIEFEEFLNQLKSCSKEIKLVRLDKTSTNATAVMLLQPEGEKFIKAITKKLRALDKEVSITFFEAKTNW